jgi:hypothetical protein
LRAGDDDMISQLPISPVRRYSSPRYPTRQEVHLDPAVLRALPERWMAKPAVCLALTLTLSTGLCGCAAGKSADTSGTTVPGLAIPIFEHGNGTGGYGCVAITPPVYLSEDEAAQIIREEAATRGVSFTETKSIDGVFPATYFYSQGTEGTATWTGTLELDGFDADLGIGFEFISKDDITAWETHETQWISWTSYDMKGTAGRLAKVVRNTAVFYDPGAEAGSMGTIPNGGQEAYQKAIDEYVATQTALARENLRDQVRDFLDWLAAQGII